MLSRLRSKQYITPFQFRTIAKRATPPLDMPIESLHSPLDLQSCAPASIRDDMLAPITASALCTTQCRRTHQTLTLIVQIAKLPNLPDAHIRVCQHRIRIEFRESLGLSLTHSLYARSNRFR